MVGHYLLHDCLGHGGHTAVYRATTPSGQLCALKLVDMRVQGGENLAQRLRRDAAILDHIGHPRILPILNPMTAEAMTAAAMPLVDGPTLRDLMANGHVDSELAWALLSQIAESLQLAHQWGLSYRVLKPANILVRDGHAYLAEFGITGRCTGQIGLASPDSQLPSAQYLAPEQILGAEPDHRADIYAFAVLVFELATATSLWVGAGPAVILHRTLNEPPPSAHERNPGIPPEVDHVLHRALARDPAGRHGSVGELIEELAYPPEPDEAPVAADAGQQPATAVAGQRPATAAAQGSTPAPVTIDSLIEVLSQVLAPEAGRTGSESGR